MRLEKGDITKNPQRRKERLKEEQSLDIRKKKQKDVKKTN